MKSLTLTTFICTVLVTLALIAQVVRITGSDGKRWRAIYRMVRNDDQWRIGGVALKEAPGTI